MKDNDLVPVGAVIPMGGTPAEAGPWLPCDGRKLKTGDYPQLFAVVKFTYGGSGEVFHLPDYRGCFLRGAARGTPNDPDAAARTSVNPSLPGGDRVGTVQDWATAVPARPFAGDAAHLPSGKWTTHGGTSTYFSAPGGSASIQTCTAGGDRETRPVNVDVNYYIKAMDALDK